jgi:hypothetical protein
MRDYSGPDFVEDSLILWEQPAFGDLAVLEPIYAVGTPLDRLAASLGSPRSDDESVLIVCQNVIHRDFEGVGSKVSPASHVLHHLVLAPILSRDRAATRNVPDDGLGQESGKGCGVPLSPRIVLTSQHSLVGMRELPRSQPGHITCMGRSPAQVTCLYQTRSHIKGSRQARHD